MESTPLFQLTLRKHCIETAARKSYQKQVDKILESAQDPTVQEAESVESLRAFLEETDFSKVRRDFPYLDGRNSLIVSVEKDHAGQLAFIIVYESV